MKVQAVFLTLVPAMLADEVALVGGVLHATARPMHLQQQLPGLHHLPRLHPKLITIDVKCLLHLFTIGMILGRNCGLLVFCHALQDTAACVVHPHVGLPM
jgi:hypothetical protein